MFISKVPAFASMLVTLRRPKTFFCKVASENGVKGSYLHNQAFRHTSKGMYPDGL